MKALFSTLIIMVLTLQLGSAAILSGNEDEASIKWKKTTIDLGELKKGKPAPATFVFNNTGKEPVIISSVKASCGCTTSKYTREPVKPGRKGEVTVTYNARRAGTFHKTVRVSIQGIKEPIVLHVKGKVIE